jgi:hypothetical protein
VVFKGNLRAKDPAAAYAKMKDKLKVGRGGRGGMAGPGLAVPAHTGRCYRARRGIAVERVSCGQRPAPGKQLHC